jgi:multisubunit Na+/H+ antiporter MnhF subunit
MPKASDLVMAAPFELSSEPSQLRMTAPSPQPKRLLALDLARVLAILFMVQGHALDVLLDPVYRQGFLWDKWLYLRGLTAPTFFMLSGFSFMIASSRHWESHIELSRPFFKRIRRFFFFIFLGYAMHVPFRTVHEVKWIDAAGWQSWFQVDVLQCIGLSLVAMQLLVLATKSQKRFAWTIGGIGASIVLLTPVMWNAAIGFWPWLDGYFTGFTGSFFPLFPWTAYVFFGAVLGFGYLQLSARPQGFPVIWLVGLGSLLVFLGSGLQSLPFQLYRQVDYWRDSPNLLFIKMGLVCLVLSSFIYLTRRIRLPEKPIQALAQESLTIYFVHICILYGSLWNAGLRQKIGATLAPLQMFAWAWFLLLGMAALGLTWHWFKKVEPKRSYWVQAAIMVAAVYSLS